MEKAAREQLYNEELNWLNRSRTNLMDALLQEENNVPAPLLDIGAGSGHAIAKLAKYGDVDAIEIAPEAWPFIEKKPVRNLYKLPIPDKNITEQYGTIVGLEVLEHIENDKETLQWLAGHLKKDGLLLLTVPAYNWLFGAHDVANHHFRRYTKKALLDALPENLKPVKSGYFMTSLFPLAATARLAYNLKNKTSKDAAIAKQKSSMPRPVDALFGKIMSVESTLAGKGLSMPFGMTVYVVARKV